MARQDLRFLIVYCIAASLAISGCRKQNTMLSAKVVGTYEYDFDLQDIDAVGGTLYALDSAGVIYGANSERGFERAFDARCLEGAMSFDVSKDYIVCTGIQGLDIIYIDKNENIYTTDGEGMLFSHMEGLALVASTREGEISYIKFDESGPVTLDKQDMTIDQSTQGVELISNGHVPSFISWSSDSVIWTKQDGRTLKLSPTIRGRVLIATAVPSVGVCIVTDRGLVLPESDGKHAYFSGTAISAHVSDDSRYISIVLIGGSVAVYSVPDCRLVANLKFSSVVRRARWLDDGHFAICVAGSPKAKVFVYRFESREE